MFDKSIKSVHGDFMEKQKWTPVYYDKWTPIYCGVTHLGEMDHTNVRVSVVVYNNFALLYKHPREYGKVIETTHANLAEAKAEGEKWMQMHYSENIYLVSAKKAGEAQKKKNFGN